MILMLSGRERSDASLNLSLSKSGRSQVYSFLQTSAIGGMSGTVAKRFVFEAHDEYAANSVGHWCRKFCPREYRY
ncbi:hypothetical protein ALC62_02512 [Cyphomyrmex costatus]|uniref:Uncharacterized protein n=1 Tax=Cyphomyrmex costatus TaxID=456900 RepID=A0A195D0J5_9HYME|nr:hypothetical protein ALC62_02512 [Cyphomyrmex costatus]